MKFMKPHGGSRFEAIKYLIDEFEFTNDQLLAFNLDWSKTRLF